MAELPLPFEALWSGALARLGSEDLRAASAASRQVAAGVSITVRRALRPLLPPAAAGDWKPSVGWAEVLRCVAEWPRILVLGGEDAADEPQLHLSLLSLCGGGRASHRRLKPTSSLPAGRYRLSVAAVDTAVYVTGGTGPEGAPCLEVLKLDTLRHRWERGGPAAEGLAKMPTPRYGHESLCVLGRYLLCIGGKAPGCLPRGASDDDFRRRDKDVGGSADCLDTATGRWLRLPCRLAFPRAYFGAAVVGTTVVVCGGAALYSGGPAGAGPPEGRLASTEVLDVSELPLLFGQDDGSSASSAPASLVWQPGPDMLFPRYDFSLAGPINGCLFAVGGSGARLLVEVLDVEDLLSRLPSEAGSSSGSRAVGSGGRSEAAPVRAPWLRRELLTEGWVDIHLRTSAPQRGVVAPALSPAEPPPTPRWVLHPVEMPDGRSSGNAVAVGGSLWFVGGSQRTVLRYTLGDPSWQPAEAELDSMRLGAGAVALGSGLLASN